jgi:phosphoribosylformylglycinamidine synthase subunit PurQ / glutaminase
MSGLKALVLRCAGTNCNVESRWALEKAGAAVEEVHINALLRGEKKLKDYGLMMIPGGFSFGDDIASGKVMANKMLYGLREELGAFVEKRRPLIGICNGFQVLVKCGLLPGLEGWDKDLSVTLTDNDSGKFECRWTFMKTASKKSVFTKGLPEVFPLPVAHGEGKFVPSTDKILKTLEANGQVLFRYVNAQGKKAGYPWNPNGSTADIAGLTNAQGNVLGMMPHPERHAFPHQHPHWTRLKPLPIQGVGLQIFKNAVRYAAQVN